MFHLILSGDNWHPAIIGSKALKAVYVILLLSWLISYIPRRKSGIYWIQVRRAAAAVEISLWTR